MLMVLVQSYMKRLRYILQSNYLFKILAILVLLLAVIYTKVNVKNSVYHNETSFVGIVYKIKTKGNKTVIYLKSKENLVINDYDNLAKNIMLGDKILVTGELKKPNSNAVFNTFNYKDYLYQNGIFYIVKASDIQKLANNTSVLYYVKNKVIKRINSIKNANSYIGIYVLGDTSILDEDILESYRENGISHLFSISGMHISLFAGLILYFLKRISYNNYYNYGIVVVFLIMYSLLVGFSSSVVRSILMYVLFAINKVFNFKIKSVDIMCLVLIIILILKPFYLYNLSFQYSYLISFSLVLYQSKIKRIKNKLMKALYVSLISFLFSFPICIYNFYQVNICSIILNIFLIPLVSIIIFPLSLISFVVPKFGYILVIFTNILEKISLFISKYKIGIITFPRINFVMIIIYYIFICLFLYNKKYVFIIILIICHKFMIYFDDSYMITTFDVGQGDSIFVRLPYGKGNILIDTGGIEGYDVVINRVIPYLKSIGTFKVHYLILSHGDYDHMGEAINLVNNFKVERVIFNCGEFNDLEKELIKVLNKKKIKYYSCIKELNIDNNKLYFLQTNIYDNENDNSNVVYTEIDGYNFMFMGDAGINKEKDILDKYNLSDIDVLKAGHHGSKTSSSEEFINEINPKYSVISVGKNNRYGHPNKEVLNILEDTKIYRTDIDGSIMYKIKNNKLKIETCSP